MKHQIEQILRCNHLMFNEVGLTNLSIFHSPSQSHVSAVSFFNHVKLKVENLLNLKS